MSKTIGPFSPWRRIGQTIATSGQIGLGDDGKVVEGGFRPELERTLRNLGNVLADAGVTREQVIKVNVYLADIADWSALNGPYAEFFGSSLPARTAVATSRAPARCPGRDRGLGRRRGDSMSEARTTVAPRPGL